MAIMVEAVTDCTSELAGLIVQGVAIQEVDNNEVEVIREIIGMEIQDIIWVKVKTNRQSFITSRKTKVEEGVRKVSPSPLTMIGKNLLELSLLLISEYKDEELDEYVKMQTLDERDLEEPLVQVKSWGLGQCKVRLRYNEIGRK